MTSPPQNRTFILALLCVASFSAAFNNLIVSPILPDISDDLGVRVAVAGLLVTGYAIAGGVAAVAAGPLLERVGRRRVVVTGMGLLTVATVCSAFAPTFVALVGCRVVAGLGVACLTPAVFSAVGDYFEYHERGRAMGWVITANTSASILGVPAGAVISGVFSWRATFVILAVLLALFTLLLWRKMPGETPAGGQREGMGAVVAAMRDRTVAMALTSSFLATAYWFCFVTYMGAYFHDEFGLPKWALGGLTMTMGIGVLIGGNVGGRLADRVGKRPIVLWTTALSGTFLLLETTLAPHIVVAGAFVFGFAACGGARFTGAQAQLTELAPERRSTVMALSAAGQQFGIVAGSLTGSLVLTLGGYTWLGPASFAMAVASLALYYPFVAETAVVLRRAGVEA
ncbi:MAG: MFS transporter [Dehalococcoidia bacterium]|nr:MFS transporter [Dehalococcoidia bacterium]